MAGYEGWDHYHLGTSTQYVRKARQRPSGKAAHLTIDERPVYQTGMTDLLPINRPAQSTWFTTGRKTISEWHVWEIGNADNPFTDQGELWNNVNWHPIGYRKSKTSGGGGWAHQRRFARVPVGNWAVDDMKVELQDANNLGLDYFFHNVVKIYSPITSTKYSDATGSGKPFIDMLTACNQILNSVSTRVWFQYERTSGTDAPYASTKAGAESAAEHLAPFIKVDSTWNPAYARHKGKALFGTYNTIKDGSNGDWLGQFKTAMRTEIRPTGDTTSDIFICPRFNGSGDINAWDDDGYAITDCILNFGPHDPPIVDNNKLIADKMHPLGKAAGYGIIQWDCRIKNEYDGGAGCWIRWGYYGRQLHNCWTSAEKHGDTDDFVYLVTWNDLGEQTEHAPCTRSGFFVYDLDAIYNMRWKFGEAAVPIVRDVIFCGHRRHRQGATPIYLATTTDKTKGGYGGSNARTEANYKKDPDSEWKKTGYETLPNFRTNWASYANKISTMNFLTADSKVTIQRTKNNPTSTSTDTRVTSTTLKAGYPAKWFEADDEADVTPHFELRRATAAPTSTPILEFDSRWQILPDNKVDFVSFQVLGSSSSRELDAPGPAAVLVETWTISPTTATVEENSSVTFTVSRGIAGAAKTVFVSVVPESGFTNSGDITWTADTQLAFSATDITKTVTIPTSADAVLDSGERFGVLVQNSASDNNTTFLAKAVITVNDPAVSSYSISPQNPTTAEGQDIVFTVTRSVTTSAQTLYVSTVDNVVASATNQGNYTPLTNQAVSFAAGVGQASVTLDVLSDTVYQPAKTFRLILHSANTGLPTASQLAVTNFTITNDDEQPYVSTDEFIKVNVPVMAAGEVVPVYNIGSIDLGCILEARAVTSSGPKLAGTWDIWVPEDPSEAPAIQTGLVYVDGEELPKNCIAIDIDASRNINLRHTGPGTPNIKFRFERVNYVPVMIYLEPVQIPLNEPTGTGATHIRTVTTYATTVAVVAQAFASGGGEGLVRYEGTGMGVDSEGGATTPNHFSINVGETLQIHFGRNVRRDAIGVVLTIAAGTTATWTAYDGATAVGTGQLISTDGTPGDQGSVSYNALAGITRDPDSIVFGCAVGSYRAKEMTIVPQIA